jgi:hypothetical protein
VEQPRDANDVIGILQLFGREVVLVRATLLNNVVILEAVARTTIFRFEIVE